MNFRHAKQSRSRDSLRYEGPRLAVSVVIFWALAAAIPLYNKAVFDGTGGDLSHRFPYPITTAALQLGFCAVVLSAHDFLRHWLRRLPPPPAGHTSHSGSCSSDSAAVKDFGVVVADGCASGQVVALAPAPTPTSASESASSWADSEEGEDGRARSWLLGPNFCFKVRHTAPIGVLFGLKYGVTNWGLHLLPLAPHLLLQTTDLMWTVLFARLFNGETLSSMELATCAGSTLGACLIAWHTQQTMPDGLYSVAVNLASPVLLGLCVTFLRHASRELLVKQARRGGRAPGMTSFEMTAMKLWISTLTVLPFALVFENRALEAVGLLRTDAGLGARVAAMNPPVTALYAAMHEEAVLGLAALGGGLFVLIFQVNMTWMSTMAVATTMGMVGALKIFPQWVVAVAFASSVDLSPLNVAGAVVLLASSMAWTYLRYDAVIVDSALRYDSKSVKRRSTSKSKRPSFVERPSFAERQSYGSLNSSDLTLK